MIFLGNFLMFLNKIHIIPVDDKIDLFPDKIELIRTGPSHSIRLFSNQILVTPTVFALVEKSSVVMAKRTHSKRHLLKYKNGKKSAKIKNL